MAKKNKSKTKQPQIKNVPQKADIETTEMNGINYPVFCFKYLQELSIKSCNANVYKCFFERMKTLQTLGWEEMRKSDRHQYGCEKIPINQIKQKKMPDIITPDVDFLFAYRYTGKKNPFLALRKGNVLHVIFIETSFGDIYDHD